MKNLNHNFFILQKLTNILMKHGKKTVSSRLVDDLIKELSYLNPYKDPIKLLITSIDKLSMPIKLIKVSRKFVKMKKRTLGGGKKIILHKPLYFLKDGNKKGLSLALHILIKGSLIYKNQRDSFKLPKIIAKEIILINNFMLGFFNNKVNKKLTTNALTAKQLSDNDNLIKHLMTDLDFTFNKSKIFYKYIKIITIEKILYKIFSIAFLNKIPSNILFFIIQNKKYISENSLISKYLRKNNISNLYQRYNFDNQKKLKFLITYFHQLRRIRLFSPTLFIYFRLLSYVNQKSRRIVYRW